MGKKMWRLPGVEMAEPGTKSQLVPLRLESPSYIALRATWNPHRLTVYVTARCARQRRRHTGEVQPVPQTLFPEVIEARRWGGAWSGDGEENPSGCRGHSSGSFRDFREIKKKRAAQESGR